MQGKKQFQEQLFTDFQLSRYVPQDNFYRRLKDATNFDFLYERTKEYYGECGQKSLDPVVFFKFCLVGYLENIYSDRRIVEVCKMRLDILFFLGYNIDEEFPWHSTISRTRRLFSDELFEEVFEYILSLCIDAKMVAGHTQAVDGAPIKANASMDSLELKVPAEELDSYIRHHRVLSTKDRQAKNDRATEDQKAISASDKELNQIKSRNAK